MHDSLDHPALSQTAAGQSVQRDAWKSIRTHISQYEQKLLELQFDYQQKVNVVEALKMEMRQLLQNSKDCEEKEYKMTQDAHNALKDSMELDRQLAAAEKDRVMLAQQLVAEQQGLADDAKKLDDTRAMFQEHLQSQHDHFNKLRAMQAGTAGADAAGAVPESAAAAVSVASVKGCEAAGVVADTAIVQLDQDATAPVG